MASGNDDIIRLVLDLVGEEGIDDFAESLKKARDASTEFSQALESLEGVEASVQQETNAFGAALDKIGDKLIGLDEPVRSVSQSMTEFEKALKFDVMADGLVDDQKKVISFTEALAALDVGEIKAQVTTNDFAKSLEALKSGMVDLDRPVSRANVGLTDFQRSLQNDVTALDLVDDELIKFHSIIETSIRETNKLEAANQKLGKTAKKTGKDIAEGATAASRAINQVAYGLSDFASVEGDFAQRLNGAVNNIQQVAAQFATSGGMFLGITVVITAVQLLAKNWDSLIGLFSKTNTEPAVQQIDSVTEALEKLDAARAKEANYKKKGEEQQERSSAFIKRVAGVGGREALVRELTNSGWNADQAADVVTKSMSGDQGAIQFLSDSIRNSTDIRTGNRMLTGKLGRFSSDITADQRAITNRMESEKEQERLNEEDQRQSDRRLEKRKNDEKAQAKREQNALDKFIEQSEKLNESTSGVKIGPSEDKLNEIRRNAEVRQQFQQYAASEGVNVNMTQASKAAVDVQKMMAEKNISMQQAGFMVLSQIVQNQNQLAGKFDQLTSAYQGLQQNAQQVGNNLLRRGNR